MSGLAQQTLNNRVRAEGVALHSGQQVALRLLPAPPDSGIRFRRTDLPGTPVIAARAGNVVDTAMSTTLAAGGDPDAPRVATVEHLMAALAGLSVDNAVIEVDGPELPIMDGSAAPFVFLLESAGLVSQPVPRRYLRVTESVCVRDGDAFARLSPAPGFQVSYTLDYDHPVMQRHTLSAVVNFSDTPQEAGVAFSKEVSRARTFGFLDDLQRLRANNLARGGSLDNAVVLDAHGILNNGGLRQEDEFVKHKILDAIGDLYLLGKPLLGAFSGHKSGHRLNNALLRKALEDGVCEPAAGTEVASGELVPAD